MNSTSTQSTIYIVIAVHDRWAMTKRAIHALQAQTTTLPWVLVLVDDGSTDGTAENTKSILPNAHIISGDGSWWWGKSMQYGLEYVASVANESDYVVLANNDQIAEPQVLENLITAVTKYPKSVCAAVSLGEDGTIFRSGYRIEWFWHKYIGVPNHTEGIYDGEIDVLPCRFSLIPAEVLKTVQFDGDAFPHYFSDHDFFLRVKKAGYKLLISYDAKVQDLGGKSGIEVRGHKITFKEHWNTMFSVKSHHNVAHHLRYYWRHAPNVLYKLWFTCALLGYYFLLTFPALWNSFTQLFRKASA